MYYKVTILTTTYDNKDREKKIRENIIVQADNVIEAENIAREKYSQDEVISSDFEIIKIEKLNVIAIYLK